MTSGTIILGAGVTGLAAGMASGLPVMEARAVPGGICSSYYVLPDGRYATRLEEERGAYRFEYGGGHWIFGGDSAVLALVRRLGSVRSYTRRSAIYLADQALFVPYPLQAHLSHLPRDIAMRALSEMAGSLNRPCRTLAEWLDDRFGPTLGQLFFAPFHERYTAGLWTSIAPQDDYKSPRDLSAAIQGAFGSNSAVGYNVRFLYPEGGLDKLVRAMADHADVHFGKEIVGVDLDRRVLRFSDRTTTPYRHLISTIPLNRMVGLCGLTVDDAAEPYTSVLVFNIGAIRGARCPDDHWIYVPKSRSGFHRVGFYSNVDRMFLPFEGEGSVERVSLYVESAFPGGHNASPDTIQALGEDTVQELKEWGFIDTVEVLDPTWIDVAYTWTCPGSSWKAQALALLERHDIYQVGRYGRWIFQGIADSIRDGLMVGGAFKP